MSKNNLVTDLVCVCERERTFWISEDILARPHNLSFKFYGGLNIEVRFELRLGLGLLWLKLGLGLEFGLGSTKQWKRNGNQRKVLTKLAL